MTRIGLLERDYYPILERKLTDAGIGPFFHPYDSRRSHAGWPDYAIVAGRWLLFAELKRTGESASVEQAAWLTALRGPWRACVLADVDELDQLVRLAGMMKAGRLDERGLAGLGGVLGDARGWGTPASAAGGAGGRPAGRSAAGRSPTRARRCRPGSR